MNTIGSPERLVVVTGAASGIGRAVVEAQLALGARVIGVDIQALAPSPEQAKAIDNGQLLAVQLDVRDSAAVDAVFDGIVERGERLTGLVSCAGVDDGGPSHEFGDDAFRRVVEINLFGTFLPVPRRAAHVRQPGDLWGDRMHLVALRDRVAPRRRGCLRLVEGWGLRAHPQPCGGVRESWHQSQLGDSWRH